MNEATLTRKEDDGTQTLGEFVFTGIDGKVIKLYSMELPWKNNKRNVSCIPKGKYKVITTLSNRFKVNMWLLLNVKNRDGIRIHSANYARQLNGCIALGISKADLDGDGYIDITSSKKAIEIARKHLGEEFILNIV